MSEVVSAVDLFFLNFMSIQGRTSDMMCSVMSIAEGSQLMDIYILFLNMLSSVKRLFRSDLAIYVQ